MSLEQSLSTNCKISLKLVEESCFSKTKDRDSKPLLDLLREKKPFSHWLFLATHGMWVEGPEKDSTLSLLVDPATGMRRLIANYKYYELIHAILLIPIFEMFVEEMSFVKDEKNGKSGATPWGIHSKIKRAELLRKDSMLQLTVTPLTFYAATQGYHRLGYSHRLAALQSAFSKKIGEIFYSNASNTLTYSCLYGVREEQEILGALLTYLSFIVRYSTEIDVKLLEAEMTTSIIAKALSQSSMSNIRRILESLVREWHPGLDMEVKKEGRSLFIEVPYLDINEDLKRIQQELKPFGRLSYLDTLINRFRNEFRYENIGTVLLDFSEQMNPCDIYLLSLLVSHELRGISSTWVICTPLTYPVAAITSLYADNLDCLGNVNLVLSSEDPYVAKLLAEKLSEELKGGKILYLAAGPTPHVFVFAKTLKDKLGDNVIFESLTP